MGVPAAASAARHPDSFSHTEIQVTREAIDVSITFQGLTLDEALRLDTDVDGFLSQEELEAGDSELGDYLTTGIRLLVPVPGTVDEERLLTGEFIGLKPTERTEDLPAGYQWFRADLSFPLDGELEEFVFEHVLFLDTNPAHSDLTRVTFSDGEPREVLFGGGWQRERFLSASPGRRGGVLRGFVRLGIDHILSGYDHLAFLLALLVATPRLRSLVGVVTAFTLAHSVTLALAALDVVSVPSHFVELAIALSIAWVGCENLARKEPRTPWVEAFGFGLLHGLGFAGFLADALSGEPLVLTALVGFNLGVELGQITVVLSIVLVLALFLRRWRRDPERSPGLAPAPLRRGISIAVAGVGFYWFLERAGWLPFV